ncbi:MAG: tripartite tricarboxylate transporter TctB family protein [Spirochaetia bacterium]|nr:tripartite tricarboxylate transporter TctB family protein [Spirochaetia bacterium]
MNKESKATIFTGIGFLLYGAAWLYAGLTMTVKGKGGDFGPAFLPKVIGATIVFLSVVLVYTAFLNNKRTAATQKTQNNGLYDYRSVIFTIVLLVLYMFTMKPIGFIISSTLYLFLQMIIMANKPGKRQIATYAIISLVLPYLVDYLFYSMFALMLPDGLLG